MPHDTTLQCRPAPRTLHFGSQPAHCTGAVLPHAVGSHVCVAAGDSGAGGDCAAGDRGGDGDGGGEGGGEAASVVAGGEPGTPPEPPRHLSCTCCLQGQARVAVVSHTCQSPQAMRSSRRRRCKPRSPCMRCRRCRAAAQLPTTPARRAHEALEHRVCHIDHFCVARLHVVCARSGNGRLAPRRAGGEVLSGAGAAQAVKQLAHVGAAGADAAARAAAGARLHLQLAQSLERRPAARVPGQLKVNAQQRASASLGSPMHAQCVLMLQAWCPACSPQPGACPRCPPRWVAVLQAVAAALRDGH